MQGNSACIKDIVMY